MYIYKVTFSNGSSILIRANSPKEADENACEKYQGLKVSHIKYIRG